MKQKTLSPDQFPEGTVDPTELPLSASQPLSQPAATSAATSERCVIAALGASAGGLEALETFFEHMPTDSGMAFVVVMHLSPDHTSALPELLARCTAMTVEQVQHDTKVIPNCVYIIPPNSSLTIKECILRVAPPEEARGHRTAIDRFFRTLAEDQGENAVCIILSGTGTDGTLGLQAVKEHGGMAMAQTLSSAKYDAILRSAIATGLVDHVLPVAEMPAKLTEYVAHLNSHNGQPNNIREQLEKHRVKIHGLLRRRVGHDFSEYKDGTIARRLERRMKSLQIETVEGYIEVLDGHPEEADLLFKDLLIGVTDFFRDPEAFEALAREVIPKLFERCEADTPIRVCVVGCASGEEAYSIAILLCEHASTLESPPEIKIFATDIDDRALENARKGCYPEGIEEHISPERLERFFVKQDRSYQVKRELRELCLFSSHSFIKDPPFSRLDLISCRNVMIYLGENLQRRVVSLFHYALRPGGYLFLGPSESVASFRELFRRTEKKHRIFQKKDLMARAPLPFPLSDTKRAKHFGPVAPVEDANLPKRLERIILKHYAPPCVVVNESGASVYFSGPISRYLEQPAGSPDTNVLNMAREGLRIPLRTALHRAANSPERVVQKHIAVQVNGETSYVDLTVEAIADLRGSDLYMVLISEASLPSADDAPEVTVGEDRAEETIHQLEGQLRSAQEHAQSIFEELETSNEELRSANEEYQSTNEELDTSREELQSFNEELETVNFELNRKVAELDTANSDLQNLLNSAQIATIFLDADLHIRNFTPTAGTMFHLIGSDIGRPITDLAAQFTSVDLVEDARGVLETLAPLERQISEAAGRFYQRRVLPYRTVHNVISGVVVTFTDVTNIRQSERAAQLARAYAESIVDTVREPLIVLDGSLRVVSASTAFYQTFHASADETLTKSFFEIGDRQWNIPELRNLLTTMLPKNQKVDDFQVEHDFRNLGSRTMLLNGRRLEQGDGKEPLLLLAIEDITERKRSADALRASELRHREIIEALPMTVYTTDTKGRITMFNEAAVEFAGRAPQPESDSWSVLWKEYLPDGTPLPFDQSPMATAIREGRPIRGVEAIVERPDGSRRDFIAYPTPLYDESGELTGGVNMLVDITDRKKTENRLRQSEDQLRSMFEQTTGGIAQTDLTGRFLMVNDGFCRIAGRSREELMNLTLRDVIHPEDLRDSLLQFTALVEGRGPNFTIETRYVHPDGSVVWVQNQVSAIHEADGKVRSIAATTTDITDRKHAEEARSLLVALVESSADAIISKDLNSTIRSWNAGAEQLFGYTAAEAIGRPITMLFPDGPADEEPGIIERMRLGQSIEPYEAVRRRKDGTTVDVSLTVSPIIDLQGRVVGASNIARDITDRKRIEEERRRMEENERAIAVTATLREMEAELAHVTRALTVGELATSIAHEVNQPLAGIVTNAEACLRWLAGQQPNLQEAQESLALIVRDGNRASEVIRRIREFLKKDSQQMAILDVNSVARETVDMARQELQKRQITLRVELEDGMPLVRGDRIQLQQVILNLIMNGSEAMASLAEESRQLLLASRRSGANSILVSVQDSGTGISFQNVDRIFDAFFTTKPTGMGMGLSISRSIVEAHGGRIWAEPNKDRGLTIHFSLPIESVTIDSMPSESVPIESVSP